MGRGPEPGSEGERARATKRAFVETVEESMLRSRSLFAMRHFNDCKDEGQPMKLVLDLAADGTIDLTYQGPA